MNTRERNIEKLQMSESFKVGGLLALAGGFLDAYTYLCRDGVFANAQTGNIVLFSINIAQAKYFRAFASAMPILAFFAGIIITEMIKSRHKYNPSQTLHWRHATLLTEIIVLTAALFIPRGSLNFLVNIMVSFICSLQVQSFRTVHGYGIASTMCTGNLRSGTEALCRFAETNDKEQKHKFICYYGIILMFILGAISGTLVSTINPDKALLFPIIAQIAAFVLMMQKEESA